MNSCSMDKNLLDALNQTKECVNLKTSVLGAAHFVHSIFHLTTNSKPVLLITSDEKTAFNLQQDLEFFNISNQLLLPFDIQPYLGVYPSAEVFYKRLKVLYEANKGQTSTTKVFVSSIQALIQKTIPKDVFAKQIVLFKQGQEIKDIDSKLENMGYISSTIVEHPGQFAKRGCVLDVFSKDPTRIEFFDNTIESIRTFDPKTGKSIKKTEQAHIIPCREIVVTDESRATASTLFQQEISKRSISMHKASGVLNGIVMGRYFDGVDYLLSYYYPNATNAMEYFRDFNLITLNIEDIKESQQKFIDKLEERRLKNMEHLILPTVLNVYEPLKDKVFDHIPESINIKAEKFNEKDKIKFLESKINEGHKVAIGSSSKYYQDKLKLMLQNAVVEKHFNPQQSLQIVSSQISQSTVLPDRKIVFMQEEDFFNKKHVEQHSVLPEIIDESRKWLLDITTDSKVIHVDHGVGFYRGLKTINIQNIENEFLEIAYKNNDKLYLPVFKLSEIRIYSGQGGLDKLGGSSWQTTKIKIKDRLKDISEQLVALYAKRKCVIKKPLDPPKEDYRKFEREFLYEETPDQIRAINDVLTDLQREHPMDRLICGDVGFGKTEVAMRAIYYSVENNKQCIFLVPTTILCLQHYNTLKERFKNHPVTIKSLSRFTPKKEINDITEGLENHRVDIVIGTHKVLNKNIKLKNLGLVIVDEEQKFGVLQKENIKKLKTNVDMLSVSATPIPRTLNMSLMGLRDLSIIKTPPKNRIPIKTFVIKETQATIRQAILFELKRQGQALYVFNKIATIQKKKAELEKLIPEANIKVAHGGMQEAELEKVAMEFYSGKCNLLLCTTIIESGLDIPQVNTMFVQRADMLGLSQLYQLRGRIGRSNKESFCYLMAPEDHLINEHAKDRLNLLKEFSKLGDGLQVARQDLEYRGSGNILGDEQAGHINEIGYELYMELLDEAINIAKNNPITPISDPDIDIPVSALIPDKYMPDIRSRLYYYRKLSKAKTMREIESLEEIIRDQFGTLPQKVLNLLGVMSIRVLCKNLGITDLKCGSKFLILKFQDNTRLNVDALIKLALDQDRYKLSEDYKLRVRLKSNTLNDIYQELLELEEKIKKDYSKL